MNENPDRPAPDDMAKDSLPRSRFIALVALAAVVPAIFALSTNNIWEDFFITFRCSLNLVQGNGLVYEAGRLVHAFTSPLGVLVPAGISYVFGTQDPQTVMDLFRLVACACLAGAWVLAAGRLQGRTAVAVAAAFWLLDPKLAAFSTNGMETGMLVLFVVWAWRALLDGHGWFAGAAFGGAMWTRPDGFLFVGAIMVGVLLFPGEKRMPVREWFKMFGLAAVIYLPWFVWAWSYYGSPVPHTILAKGGNLLSPATLGAVATYPFRLLFDQSAAHAAFLPPYYFLGGWSETIWWFGKVLTYAVIAAAVWPGCPRPSRVAAVAFLLGGWYLTVTPPAPWYLPAWQVLAYLALGGLFAALWKKTEGALKLRVAAGAALALVVGYQGLLFVSVTQQLREQQRIVEWGLRRSIGTDLAQMASSTKDTVFLEPLGYIGYFSGLAMRDTPGLCAPEVVAVRRSGARSMSGLIAALKPNWAVLRSLEFSWMNPGERSVFLENYELVSIHDVRAEVDAVRWLPGRGFLHFDSHFGIWRRKQD